MSRYILITYALIAIIVFGESSNYYNRMTNKKDRDNGLSIIFAYFSAMCWPCYVSYRAFESKEETK